MKFTLITAIIFGLVWNGMGDKIKCYKNADVKDGFNSSGTIVESAEHDACFVKTIDGVAGATRGASDIHLAICTEFRNKTCTGGGWSTCAEITTKTCHCVTNLCNNAPAATTALMPIIVMTLMAKFLI